MKHIKAFNESKEKRVFKNTDDDIKEFFINYFDDNRISIENSLLKISSNEVIEETSYMKDVKDFRKCKVVTIRVSKLNGVKIGMTNCLNNLDIFKNVIRDIETFYEFLGEEVNFKIDMDYMGLSVKFVLLGDDIESEESDSDKIDKYLLSIKEVIHNMGHKRVNINSNNLDIKFTKKGDTYNIWNLLNKVGNGQINLQNYGSDWRWETTNNIDLYLELVNIRNEAWENGLKFDVRGYDKQVVLGIIRI